MRGFVILEEGKKRITSEKAPVGLLDKDDFIDAIKSAKTPDELVKSVEKFIDVGVAHIKGFTYVKKSIAERFPLGIWFNVNGIDAVFYRVATDCYEFYARDKNGNEAVLPIRVYMVPCVELPEIFDVLAEGKINIPETKTTRESTIKLTNVYGAENLKIPVVYFEAEVKAKDGRDELHASGFGVVSKASGNCYFETTEDEEVMFARGKVDGDKLILPSGKVFKFE